MTTTSISGERTLGDIVAERGAAARVFERHGLDYCCHGQDTLAKACAEAGIDAEAVAADLDGLAVEPGDTWSRLDMATLADHIVVTHHHYLREELPLLVALADKVSTVHGQRHAELAQVHSLVSEVWADLEPHMDKEDNVLFPAIHAIAGGVTDLPFGSIANPIAAMVNEHDQVGELLTELRRVTGGYSVPADGCASYQSLYQRLEHLELDTHLHVLKENHTLFPAAIAAYDAAVGS